MTYSPQASQSARPELLKQMNQELIIRTIVRASEISRSELARQTGLALPSIMRLVDDLVSRGVVIDCGQGISTGGRKPNLLVINKDYKWIVGVEIAINSIITLADFSGQPIAARLIDGRIADSPKAVLVQIGHAILNLLKQYQIPKERVAAIGVGTPGSDFKHRKAIKGFMQKGWESLDVGRLLQEATGIKCITENVCRTRTLSEIWFGQGRNHNDFLYGFVDWGVGVGIVNHGELFIGKHGVAGEFGHMSIDRKGEPCYCGNEGCIEMYASVGAVERALLDRPISWALEHQDDADVINALSAAADAYALALGNVVNLLNPPLIVLGGFLPRMFPTFVEQVQQRLNKYIFHNFAIDTPLVCSCVDNESVCLGSIALVIHHELMHKS